MNKIDKLIDIQRECLSFSNDLEELGLDMASHTLWKASNQIGDILHFYWTGGEE